MLDCAHIHIKCFDCRRDIKDLSIVAANNSAALQPALIRINSLEIENDILENKLQVANELIQNLNQESNNET